MPPKTAVKTAPMPIKPVRINTMMETCPVLFINLPITVTLQGVNTLFGIHAENKVKCHLLSPIVGYGLGQGLSESWQAWTKYGLTMLASEQALNSWSIQLFCCMEPNLVSQIGSKQQSMFSDVQDKQALYVNTGYPCVLNDIIREHHARTVHRSFGRLTRQIHSDKTQDLHIREILSIRFVNARTRTGCQVGKSNDLKNLERWKALMNSIHWRTLTQWCWPQRRKEQIKLHSWHSGSLGKQGRGKWHCYWTRWEAPMLMLWPACPTQFRWALLLLLAKTVRSDLHARCWLSGEKRLSYLDLLHMDHYCPAKT